jgi:hypothetical protein
LDGEGRLAFEVEEFVANAVEEHVVSEVGQVGVPEEHGVIVEATVDSFIEGGSGLFDFVGQRIAAGEVIKDDRIIGQETGEADIDLESGLKVAALGVISAEDLEGFDIGWIAFEEPFHEGDFEVQIATFACSQFSLTF